MNNLMSKSTIVSVTTGMDDVSEHVEDMTVAEAVVLSEKCNMGHYHPDVYITVRFMGVVLIEVYDDIFYGVLGYEMPAGPAPQVRETATALMESSFEDDHGMCRPCYYGVDDVPCECAYKPSHQDPIIPEHADIATGWDA
tara:strand:+ start:166 stop:585 length:420 start_codon:yes stop_codon:yes gene_type:complete